MSLPSPTSPCGRRGTGHSSHEKMVRAFLLRPDSRMARTRKFFLDCNLVTASSRSMFPLPRRTQQKDKMGLAAVSHHLVEPEVCAPGEAVVAGRMPPS